MVRFDISGGIDPLLNATLEKGDAILAESNAMVAMDRECREFRVQDDYYRWAI